MLGSLRKLEHLTCVSPKILPLLLSLSTSVSAAAQEFACSGYEPPPLPAGAVAKRSRPTTTSGTVNVLVIYAKFKDEAPHNQTPPAFASQLFDVNLPGSFSHFYNEMSGGQLTVEGSVLPKRYSSDRPAAAYLVSETGRYGNYAEFLTEIVTKADRDVDLSQFDNDGDDGIANSGDDDGFVDYIFVNTLSTPRGFITGGATGIANLGSIMLDSNDAAAGGGTITIAGSINHGALQQEGNYAQTVGSMAHEFGHRLGLPDYYDLSFRTPEEDSAGIGRWGLMGWGAHGLTGQDGPAPFSARSLELLGWIGRNNEKLIEVETDATGLEVADFLSGGNIYKVPLRMEGTGSHFAAQEYLLLEQVTQSSSYYRRNIPGEGLLVWHIRPQSGGNGDETKKGLDLICADGLYADSGFPRGRLPDGRFGRDNLDYWAHDAAYAEANGGNRGDATDPFDGVRATRLDQFSNPSNNPWGFSSTATTGLRLDMNRRGSSMMIDITQPRWAGIINEQVHWSGNVIVDGDVRVASDGELHIHSGTKVRISGSDRLQGGMDPNLSELEINGDLIVGHLPKSEVVFESLHPGERWYGIVIDPADSSRIEVASSNIVLHDVLHGFVFQRAPSALKEPLVDFNIALMDTGASDTAGNGDGSLNPGETVQLEVTLNNWTMQNFKNVKPSLHWDTELLEPAWERGIWSERYNRLTVENSFNLDPGKSHFEVLPLKLSREAEPGTEIEIVVKYGHQTEPDTLNFVVAGKYPQNDVDFEVPGHDILGRSALLPSGKTTTMRALVRGDIAAADLMVRTIEEHDHVMTVPMEKLGLQGESHLFEASIPPELEGFFEVFVRVTGQQGFATFADSTLLLGMTSGEAEVLTFVSAEIGEENRANLVEVLDRVVTAQGQSHYVIDGASEQGEIYEVLLPAVARNGGTVLWMGDEISREARIHMTAFLEQGGRMVISSRFLRGSGAFVRDVLHVQRHSNRAQSMLFGLDLKSTESFRSTYSPLSLVAPAEPMLYDDAYNPAAMRVDTGAFRLVYFPFDLAPLDVGVTYSLLEAGLAYLNSGSESESSLAFEVEDTVGESLLLRGGNAATVRVQAPEEILRADLEVRSLPNMEIVQTVPMAREEGGEFSASVPAVESGHFLFSARIFDAQENSLPNSARRQVLRLLDRPNLVFVNQSMSPRFRSNVRGSIKEAMSMNHTTADIIDYPERNKAIYEELVLSYAGENKTLFWFGEFGGNHVPEMLQRFLDHEGRLFLGSKGRSLHSITELVENYLFTTPLHYEEKQLESVFSDTTGVFLNAGARISHRKLTPHEYAIPFVLSTNGHAAGVHVDPGSYRAIFLAFDVARLSDFAGIVGNAMPLLGQDLRQDLELNIPGSVIHNDMALMLQDEIVPMQVTTTADVDSVDLLVRGSAVPRGLVLPLNRSAEGEAENQRLFTASFAPPGSGNYKIVARVRTRDGRRLVGSQLLNVDAVHFEQWNPVLVVDKHTKVGAPVVEDIRTILQTRGLEANVLNKESKVLSQSLYDILLQQYLGPGRFVIWLSPRLTDYEQDLISNFARQGGRVLLATQAMAYSPTGGEFRKSILGIEPTLNRGGFGVFEAVSGSRADGRIAFAQMVPRAGTEPVLQDTMGRVAATRLDAGMFRTIYVGLDLPRTLPESRLPFLGEQIAFLQSGVEVELSPHLEIASVLAPGQAARADMLVPQLLVSNAGNERSQPFRVEYRILRSGTVVASRQQQQPALDAFTTRTIEFPALEGLPRGAYQVQFGMATTFDGLATFQDPSPLELVEVPVTYSVVEIEADVYNSNGAGFFDFDGDNDLDFLLVRPGEEDQFLRNDGNVFRETGVEVGLADDGYGRGFAVGDYDSDGDLDVYLVRQGQENRLLRNEQGSFVDVTSQMSAEAGAVALGERGVGRSAGFWDADADGDLDLFLVNASPDTNRVFRNDGAVFADMAPQIGLDDGGNGRGMSFGDFDRDGDADVLVANKDGPSMLYRNDEGRFAEVGEEFGVPFSNSDVAGVFGDYDEDGYVDIFTTSESADNRLFKNLEGTGFDWVTEEKSGALGASCAGAAFVDTDNDGDLDLITTGVGRGNGGDQLYANYAGGWNSVGGFAGLATESSGRGLSIADFDGDGDQDLLIADAGSSRLYRSELEDSHWLHLDLIGTGGNRNALGATIQVVTPEGRQYRELHPGFGYGSQAPPEVHFGLGAETRIDTLRIVWPDGRESVRTDLQVNRQLQVSYPRPPMSLAADAQALPEVLTLFPNFPNPFNAQTVINYQLPKASPVEFSIYNVTGQRIRHIVAAVERSGLHSITWDGTDDAGRAVGTGVYMYQLSSGQEVRTSRLLLVK
jgi:M6 family metalloprotease-like protein